MWMGMRKGKGRRGGEKGRRTARRRACRRSRSSLRPRNASHRIDGISRDIYRATSPEVPGRGESDDVAAR